MQQLCQTDSQISCNAVFRELMFEKAPLTGVSPLLYEMLPITNNNKTVQTKEEAKIKNKDLRAESSNNNIIIIVLLEPCEVLFEGTWERKAWAHRSQCTQANQRDINSLWRGAEFRASGCEDFPWLHYWSERFNLAHTPRPLWRIVNIPGQKMSNKEWKRNHQ